MSKYMNMIKEKKIAIVIYMLLFIYFLVQMNYYADNVERFPDEGSHIAYVTYLELSDSIIPDFYNMPQGITNADDGTISSYGISYLGHPPLYYNILNLFTNITGDGVYNHSDVDSLRTTSQGIACIGLLLAFGYGFVKLNKNALHLLFGTLMISVPMLSYTAAGVNNDTLAFTGMVIFFIALERLVVKREGWFTYFLFAMAVAIVMLTKLTAAIILVVTCLAVFIYIMLKEKSIRLLWNKYFLVTIPIYLMVLVYYLYIYSLFGSFQPTLQAIDYEYFMTTTYYIDESLRVHMEFGQYMSYYTGKFLQTWSSIASHVSLLKEGSYINVDQIGLMSILVVPLLGFLTRNKTPQIKIMLVSYVVTITTMCYQALSNYSSFLERGYLGGYQSRYYLCVLIAFVFIICFAIQERYQYLIVKYPQKIKYVEIGVSALCVVWSLLVIYEDFIYFIIYFGK